MKYFLKQKSKQLFSNKYFQTILAWVVHFLVWFIYKTSRIKNVGNYEELSEYNKNGKSIFVFTWHGRMIISPIGLNEFFKDGIQNGKKLSVLASGHRDGKIASTIASTFGIEPIEGSTIDPKKGSQKNKKSLTSIREIIKVISQNRAFLFAADAPRGPAFHINSKITNIAQLTEVPIVCIGVIYKNKIQLKTWDNFQIPLPFGEIIFSYGDIHSINKDENIEEINNVLQDELNRLSDTKPAL